MDARMGPVEREVMALIMLVAQDASASKLAALEAALERLPAMPTEYLWTSYAVAVVHTMLQGRSVSPPTIECGLSALYKLFTRCKLGPLETTPDLFVTMIKTLLVYLPPLDSSSTSSALTEDGRNCIVQCIGLLATRTAPATFFTPPTDEMIEVAFLTVAYLLQQAEKEVARASRVQALEALIALLRSIDNVDVVALLLPGVVAKMLQLTHHADYKWGSKVPAKALECLSEVVFLGLRDSRWPHLVSKPEFTLEAALTPFATSPPTPLLRPNSSKPEIDRSRAWLETTQANLAIALDLICRSQRHHAKPRVRLSLVTLCSVVVCDCRWSLAPSFFSAFEALLSLSLDPILDVQTYARQALDRFHATMTADEGLWLTRHATSRVVSHLRALAKKCATDVEMEAEACATLQVVLAYDQSTRIAFDAVLTDLLRAMQTILRIDHVDAHVLAHEASRSRSPSAKTVTFAYYRKRFVHIRSDAAVRLATQVLRRIGARGSTLVWIDHLMAQLRNESERSTELLLVLNHFVLGAGHIGDLSPTPDTPPLSVHMVGYLLDQLLQLPQWTTLPVDATPLGRHHLRLGGAAADSTDTTSVLLEILGSCAEALDIAFHPLLMHVLYPIAEHLAGHSSVVHQAATATLDRIAFHCAYDDVPALLHGNMDYVIDMLCSRLEQLEMYPHTPFVVEGLLAHAGSTPLPLLQDAIKSVLRSVDRYVSSGHSAGLLRVMKVIVTTAPHLAEAAPVVPRSSKLDAFLKEMKTLFDPNMGAPDDAASEAQLDAMLQDNADDESAVLERKMKAAMPVEHEPEADASDAAMRDLIKDIIVRSSYFMAAPDVATSCLASSVLSHAVLLLPLNDLRPVAARVWPAVVKRLGSTAKPVVLAALHCLSALAVRCGDFLADRFVSEAWPAMRLLLLVDSHETLPVLARHELVVDGMTLAPSSAASSSHSLTHQIHVQCLECLTRMCTASPALESIEMDVARVTSPMLRSSSSPSLQEGARRLFLALAALNGDALFPLLADLGTWALPSPPTSAFPAYGATAVKNVKHPVSTSASTAAYTANARELLRYMHAHP
ncbi:hypothetical protein SDRG_10039 [Saprolegnia diclina VS20]|uniref:Uncharacterized protein n=1 Tax=Saprolegnia diclina (strain VS20) TaxID=1156394 RepID=T0RQE9_SAPDV|nr:hypothetical protein SDRG_10039 [Saprolegnia diclina VS20]EQC32292.1 hypothetical protein SDRG_10039 [Saprolegnia diclina VS20]|eukprot:XP_008614233.1 hypothetical protein SDRG_10039 [Saprolegnia diclina VS20]